MKKIFVFLAALLVTLTAYATVTTITFDATVDTNLDAYTASGNAWAYVTGSGANLTVSADNDNVQCTGNASADYIARYTGTGTTTGDQDVSADLLIKDFNPAGVGARFSAVADTGYLLIIDTAQTNEVRLFKRVAGVLGSPLGTWDDGILANTTVNASLRVTGSGDWEVQAGAGVVHTGTDSSSPLTSGHPAIYCNTDEGFPTIDNFVLDDLAGSGSSVPAIFKHLRQQKQ